MKMIRIGYLIFAGCLVLSSAEDQKPEEPTEIAEPPKDDASRILTEVGYLRYGDPFYVYPTAADRRLRQPVERNPTETNEIDTSVEKKRPLFIFTTYEPSQGPSRPLSDSPYIEIRKKREAVEEIPESSKVGKLRRKRTYCHKCGGGGYGGYGGYTAYIPVSYVAYPVYTAPVYYGGGGGCNTCGGGGKHGGGFGGYGGTFSSSSSSSKSSSKSYSWGK